MDLGEKLRRLRNAEGLRRGMWRAMTQHEVVRAMRHELGASLSQAYLSQLEGGKRAHLSNATREALARFYHVHPGYLVSDPPGYLATDPGAVPDGAASQSERARIEKSFGWLGATLANQPDPERTLRLFDRILSLDTHELERLEATLNVAPIEPDRAPEGLNATTKRSRS